MGKEHGKEKKKQGDKKGSGGMTFKRTMEKDSCKWNSVVLGRDSIEG